MTWYLVMASLYIGPFAEDSCKKAAQYIPAMCKQADYVMLCPVPDHPEAFTACPHFTYPAVTIK